MNCRGEIPSFLFEILAYGLVQHLISFYESSVNSLQYADTVPHLNSLTK